MRQWLHGHQNTGSGAKFAREAYIKAIPGSTVTIGYDHSEGRKFLDIIPPIVVESEMDCMTTKKAHPHLQLVKV